MSAVTIRRACLDDCEEIFQLFRELKSFENRSDEFKTSFSTFRRNGFETDNRFTCLVAETQPAADQGIVGFLLYTTVYFSWTGGYMLQIEEVFIKENNRRKGIGTALIQKSLQILSEEGFHGLRVYVDNSNKAYMGLLKDLGAVNAAEKEDIHIVRVFGDQIKENMEKLKKCVESVNSEEGLSPTSDTRQVSVRDARVEDCEEIVKMMHMLGAFEGLPKREIDLKLFQSHGFGDGKRYHCFVAEDNHASSGEGPALIGYLAYTWMYTASRGSDIMYIEDVYVTEKYRKAGVGKLLFEQAIKAAADKGYSFVQLTARKNNIPAMKFYKKFGAVNITEDKGISFLHIRKV